MASFELYRGDCLDIMADIPDQSIDLILCDLPYGTTQNKWDTVIPFGDLWSAYHRICNGAIVLTAAQPFTSALVMSNISNFRYQWVWKKSKPTGHLNAKKQPLRNTEDVLVFYSKQPVYNPQGTKPTDVVVSRTNRGNYGACSKTTRQTITGYPTTVLEFATENGVHPTQKPVPLMEYLINTYTNESGIVLDNCMGSGTTGVACANTGRNFIGIEREKEYYHIARKRIAKAYTKKPA
ncbi:MAG: DNA-methyltransferase [Kluyvera sp.]|uniref:DNA-methyltransferase n=1 Tax=Kluyvera sp. TaxID=1538228 RepID=UPI003F2E4344